MRLFHLLGGAAATALTIPIAALAQPASEQIYELPGQALTVSLRELAAQSGRAIVVSTDRVKALQAPALQGRYSVEAALERLLRGLRAVRSGDGFAIIPAVGEKPTGWGELVARHSMLISRAAIRKYERCGLEPKGRVVLEAEDIPMASEAQRSCG